MDDTSPVLKVRDGSVIWRELDGETVVVEVSTATYLGTNASGTSLWRALVDGATREQLVHRLLDEFDVEEPIAASAVDDFVAACRQRGLLDE